MMGGFGLVTFLMGLVVLAVLMIFNAGPVRALSIGSVTLFGLVLFLLERSAA